MVSFRIGERDAKWLAAWADKLEVDRSELIRKALHTYLLSLQAEHDIEAYEKQPITEEEERALDKIQAWLPAEDWSDWIEELDKRDAADAAG